MRNKSYGPCLKICYRAQNFGTLQMRKSDFANLTLSLANLDYFQPKFEYFNNNL